MDLKEFEQNFIDKLHGYLKAIKSPWDVKRDNGVFSTDDYANRFPYGPLITRVELLLMPFDDYKIYGRVALSCDLDADNWWFNPTQWITIPYDYIDNTAYYDEKLFEGVAGYICDYNRNHCKVYYEKYAQQDSQSAKKDAGKLRMDLIPPSAYTSLARVLTYGAEKYEENSWQQVERKRYLGAILRHLVAYMDDPYGVDSESGLYHIEHVLCNAAFLNDMTVNREQYKKESGNEYTFVADEEFE